MLCNDRNLISGLLGKKESGGEARDASTRSLLVIVRDNEKVYKPNYNNAWHDE